MTENLYDELLNASFRFVSYRPRSSSEIFNFLKKKSEKRKIDRKVIDQVMARLTELGYCDDKKFVQWWIDSRSHRKPKGRIALRAELKEKGIDHDLVASLDQEIDELDLAGKAAMKLNTKIRNLPRLKQKKKLYGFLGRRGFSAATIHQVVDELMEKDYNIIKEK